MRKGVSRDWFSPFALLHPGKSSIRRRVLGAQEPTDLGAEAEGTAAASAAALANPWRASMGAFKVARGKVSSDSSSDEAAVLGMIP